MKRPVAMLILALVSLSSTSPASSQETPSEEPGRVERLVFLQNLADEYRIVVGRDRVAKRSPHPIYRWSHPVGSTADGITYMWMDDEQPVAIGSMMILQDRTLSGEFQSLTSEPIKAVQSNVTIWEPTKPGCEYVRVPDAPKPADSQAERLTQKKLLARRFSAELTKRPPAYSEGSIW